MWWGVGGGRLGRRCSSALTAVGGLRRRFSSALTPALSLAGEGVGGALGPAWWAAAPPVLFRPQPRRCPSRERGEEAPSARRCPSWERGEEGVAAGPLVALSALGPAWWAAAPPVALSALTPSPLPRGRGGRRGRRPRPGTVSCGRGGKRGRRPRPGAVPRGRGGRRGWRLGRWLLFRPHPGVVAAAPRLLFRPHPSAVAAAPLVALPPSTQPSPSRERG